MKQKTYQIGVVGGEEDEVTPTNSYMRARSNGSILIPRRQDCNPTDGLANSRTDNRPTCRRGGVPETCDLGGLKVACAPNMGQATPLRSSGHACYRMGPPAGAQLPLRGPAQPSRVRSKLDHLSCSRHFCRWMRSRYRGPTMFPGRDPETQVTPTYFVILARQCMATEYGVQGEVPCRPRQSLACALIDQASSQPYFNALKAAQTQLCNSRYHRAQLLESCPAPRCDLSRAAHVAYEVGNLRASPW